MKNILLFSVMFVLMAMIPNGGGTVYTFSFVPNTGITGQVLNSTTRPSLQIWVSKSAVGLSNADNTSDINKPLSNAVKAALLLKADKGTTTTTGTVDLTAVYVEIANLKAGLQALKDTIYKIRHDSTYFDKTNFSGTGAKTSPIKIIPAGNIIQ